MSENEKQIEECDLEIFCKQLPKIELHAHLNGSLDLETLKELSEIAKKNSSNSSAKEDDNLERYVCEDGRQWSRLAESFGLAHRLTGSPEAVTLATRRTVEGFARDGCVHLELRSTPRPVPTRRHYVDAVLEGLRQSESAGMTSVFVVSLDRSWPADVVEEVTELAALYHRLHPDLVVGVDLCGDPGKGEFRHFVPALTRARDAGLKLTLHCGEVSNPDEVVSMLALRPERVGHAVFVHPATGGDARCWRALKEARACVEVCLTSNVVTGSVDSLESHHVRHLLEEGVPFVICTDDAGVFGTSLSGEYARLARLARPRSAAGIARLARRACDHAFAPETVKCELRRRFDEFCGKMRL